MIYIIIMNVLASILVYVVMKAQQREDALFCAVVTATIPGIGALMILSYKTIKYLEEKFILGTLKSVEEEDEPINIMLTGQFKEKVDVIAVSEALVLNDRKTKKEALINILREDKTKYIETLKEAVQDEDTEASHYGAVALMDIKDAFNSILEKWEGQLKSEEEADQVDLETYVEVLGQSIDSGLNDRKRQEMLENRYTNLLEQLIKEKGGSKSLYAKKVNIDIKVGRYKEAESYCQMFITEYPDNEESYFALMKLYYTTKDDKGFNETLGKLRSSKVILSKKGLELIRFWIGGEQ